MTVQRGPFNAFWMRGIGAEDKDAVAAAAVDRATGRRSASRLGLLLRGRGRRARPRASACCARAASARDHYREGEGDAGELVYYRWCGDRRTTWCPHT